MSAEERLEQILDARLLARVTTGQLPLEQALLSLRSRAGFESFLQKGLLANTTVVTTALAKISMPVTQAFLIPSAPESPRPVPLCALEPVVVERLRESTLKC